ncbi:MAG: MFS transporter [Candidatus Nanopelagicales bacterium]|nr:MFS transporter [Candidatus Nanopelagicales bacterium]
MSIGAPSSSIPGAETRSGGGLVLTVLASAQFLMTLDSTVMNVSMAQVASDLGTTISGIQVAITMYTLVMATLMITGGKIGTIVGRRRVLAIGIVIYGIGALVTAASPNVGVLILGWSGLEGLGAALIMPAVVALVASNFPPAKRAATYGILAASCAAAVAAGPLIGGAVTTYASWRYVFLGEAVVVVVILMLIRRVTDLPPARAHLDLVGSLLSVVGLGSVIVGVLRSSEWGWVSAKPGAPSLFGASLTLWLIIGGLAIVYVFTLWESHVAQTEREPLVDPAILRNRQLSGGLSVFFFQYLVQAGVFFTIPLFLSVVLQLSSLETGVRIFPLSVALLVAAAGIPKIAPRCNPRRVVRFGLSLMTLGIMFLVAGMNPGASAAVVAIPMLLIGLGLGAIASQLGAVTVSAVPDSMSGEVGGLQNTATNLGASLGTALIGSVLIATLTSAALAGIQSDSAIPGSIQQEAVAEFSSGIPFISDAQLVEGLKSAGVDQATSDQILQVNRTARLDALRVAFGLAALLSIGTFFFTGRLPTVQPGEVAPVTAAGSA